MIIGGFEKFSLLDYPDNISAIVFTQGCNFRCHFCYNPMLVWPIEVGGRKNNVLFKDETQKDRLNSESFSKEIQSEDDLFNFLKDRVGKLDAVVITGGEPTMHADLPVFIAKIKVMGFKVKLDTNGTNPKMLEKLIFENLLDYIAMDIKGPFSKYKMVTGVEVDLGNIEKSCIIIKASSLPHEFRTTVVPGLFEAQDIEDIGEVIRGADKWFLQKFKSDINLVDNNFQGAKSFSDKEMQTMRDLGAGYVGECQVR